MVRAVCAETRALARFYRIYSKLSYRRLAVKCGISKSTAHRICTNKKKVIKTAKKCGRPASLNEREERKLLRTFKSLRKKYVHFSVKDLMTECGLLASKIHPRTISRYLNKHGFRFRQARKKGLLNESDERLRTSYARKMKLILQSEPDFYTNHLAFYLDGVSFIHKNDPRKAAIQPKSRVWRRRGEGLSFTAKGSKSLAGGRRLHIIAAIASQKGVILRKDYEKMDGGFFAKFIREHFNLCFGKAGPKAYGKRSFLMDNDPSQTSKKAMSALSEIECDLHEILPRSPDLNPIENVFNLVKKTLEKQAIERNITKESFNEFKARVFRCFDILNVATIDRTIESMPKRIERILKSKGKRIKY